MIDMKSLTTEETGLQEDLEALLSTPPAGPCLSIYLPSEPVGAGDEPARLVLLGLLRRARERLEKNGPEETAKILGPLQALVSVGAADFWRHQDEGLGLFVAPGFFRQVPIPFPVAARLEVADHFVLRPLLPLLSHGPFYVLALSRNEVRLLEVRGRQVRRLDLGNTPRSLEEALGEQFTTQILQYHTASSPKSGGGLPAVYHGRGTGEEDAKAELRRYFQRVDAGLAGCLKEDFPLVLAGVEYLLPIYRAVSHLPRIAAAWIAGNPEHMSDGDLAHRARPLAEPMFAESRKRALARYAGLAGGPRASRSLAEILPAAGAGRVDVLFLSTTADPRGRWGKDGRVHPGADDLLDIAAVTTLGHRGMVYALRPDEMPDGVDAAAIFRY